MKKLSLVTKICSSVFLFIFILAIALSIPVFKKLQKVLDNYTELFSEKVTSYSGLTLSYDSISPSIFSYLGIKGVRVKDSNDTSLVQVKNLRIKYKLFPLLKGNYDSIVKSIVIDGVVLDAASIADYVSSLMADSRDQEVKKPPAQLNLYDYVNLAIDYIPQNITLKNLSVNYLQDSINASLLVKEIRVLNSQRKDYISFNIKSQVNTAINNNNPLNGEISFNGRITRALENSYSYINLSDFVYGKYRLNKFNFLLSYNQKKVSVRTVQNVIPLEVEAEYSFNDEEAGLKLMTQGLSPLSVLTNASSQKDLQAFKELNLSLTAGLNYKIKSKELAYNAGGSVFVPDSLFPKSAQINFDLSGNDKKLELKKLEAAGENINAYASLSCIFEKLQLSGIIELNEFKLANGKSISTELYFDPLAASGFMLFSPQVFVGDRALTALQATIIPHNDSIDFDLEVSDFSHTEEDNLGIVKAGGSYLTKSKYVQTSLSFETFYLETILALVEQVLSPQAANSIAAVSPSLKDFMFSGEAYASTDLHSLSYNLPYLVIANTKQDNQYLLLALNGNEQSIQVNHFNLIYGNYAFEATASLDSMPDSSDKFYTLDIMASSIPYHFAGTIMPEIITLTGDYGIDAEVRFDKDKSVNGFASFTNLPFLINNSTFILSLDTLFDYTKEQGPEITLRHLQIEKDEPETSVNPRLELSGSGTRYGAQINNISYTDLYSSLRGNSDITVNIAGKVLNSAGIQMNIKDDLTDEALVIDATVSNPENVELDAKNIANALYVNAMIQASHFSLNRFMSIRNDNNEITASLYLSGTLEHPYATASVEKMTFLLNDEIVSANGSLFLEERDVNLDNFILKGASWQVGDVSGNFSLADYTGVLKACLSTQGEKNIIMPLELTVEDSYVEEGSAIPESFTAKLSCPELSGSLFKKPVAFDLFLNYSKDFISFYSSENAGVYGSLSNEDGLYASIKTGDIMSAEITGSLKKDDSFVKISNINVDLKKLLRNITMDDIFVVDQGILKGSMTIRNPADTPDFKGALSIASPVFQLPSVFNYKLSTEKVLITAANNEFTMAEANYNIKNSAKFKMSSRVYMNKWVMDHFDMKITSLEKQLVPVSLKTPLMTIEGDTDCDFTMTLENNNLDFTGSFFVENLNIESNLTDLAKMSSENQASVTGQTGSLTTNLQLSVGTHAALNFNPLLRCVFVPHTSVVCKINTEANFFQLDGSLLLKSGDVAYLNRNFYIKEGSIKFNPLDFANPQVTIKAETRERDTDGNTIRIILSAENQYLLDFNPVFSSVPAKSETEIKLLLGQIVLADSDSVGSLVLSAGEYYLQSTIVRNLENKLRELLNFDIFSIRTNILQNTITLGNQRNKTKELTVGNFFDNSTVYIGKYLGSTLYADAMLNMSASDYHDVDYLSANSILFQPELGLELELSVINIRWDMAWRFIPGVQLHSFVPDTTVSLSWKFNF